VSAIQLETTSRHAVQLISDAEVLVTKARRLFDGVSVGCLDATRAEPGLLLGFAQAMSSLGARRVRIADTVGVGDPFSVHRLFAQLTGAVPSLDFEFQGHNDLGMATANGSRQSKAEPVRSVSRSTVSASVPGTHRSRRSSPRSCSPAGSIPASISAA
jgi:hypothetical protein